MSGRRSPLSPSRRRRTKGHTREGESKENSSSYSELSNRGGGSRRFGSRCKKIWEKREEERLQQEEFGGDIVDQLSSLSVGFLDGRIAIFGMAIG